MGVKINSEDSVVIGNVNAGGENLDTKDEEKQEKVTMKKNINVLHGTCFIVSTIIGTGIFISPNSISRNVNSPGMSILIWLGGGIIATIGGITYCELGNMFARNGAEITYLRQAYGAMMSFLSCFLLHFVLSGLRRAIQFLSFSRYFWRVFYEDSSPPWILDKAVCILIIALLITVIALRPSLTLKIIDAVTVAKLVALGVVIVIGIVHLAKGKTENLEVGFEGTNLNPQLWGEAWTNVLWAYNGWNVVCIVLGEVKNPRDLSKIIAIAMSIVTVFYMLAVVSYHAVLPMEIMNSDKPIASELANVYLGKSGVIFFAVAVAISSLGNSMTAILGASRYLQAGGAQGVLPSVFGLVNRRFRTPVFSLLFLFTTTTIFTLVGDLSGLINSATFTSFFFVSCCAAGVVVMRFTKPDHPRPVRVFLLFPILTATFGVYMIVIPWFGNNVVMSGVWVGITVLIGIPSYFLCVNKTYRQQWIRDFSGRITDFFGRILNSEVNLQ